MISSKQRANLRSMANTLAPIFQIGKGNINDNFIEQIDGALETRELIKISILETADITAREASDQLCEALGAEPVQCIGRKLVLYRPSRENQKIEIELYASALVLPSHQEVAPKQRQAAAMSL